MVDITNLEEYAKAHLDRSKEEWDIELSIDDLVGLVFDEVGECIDDFNQRKAEQSIRIILDTLYYYQYGKENTALKKIKDAARDHEKAIKHKVKNFKDILNDGGFDVDELHQILDDMYQNPYKYAKTPEKLSEAELSKEYVKNTIIMALTVKLNEKLCVRKASRLIKKLDNKYNSIIEEAVRAKFKC